MAERKNKSLDKEIVQAFNFRVLCKGRNERQMPALGLTEDVVSADVSIRLHPEGQMLSLDASCRYNCGAHGEECCAAGKGSRGMCAYSIDLLHAIDTQYRRQE